MAVISGGGTVPESGIGDLKYSLSWTDLPIGSVRTIPAVGALILRYDTDTGITETITEKVHVYATNGAIQVTSGTSNPIKEVAVYNLQGILIYKASEINATSHTVNLMQPAGVYIVKVLSDHDFYKDLDHDFYKIYMR
jgi:hypothetical protein